MNTIVKISIVDEDQSNIRPSFIKANSAVLKKFSISNSVELETYWFQEYGIRLDITNKNIIFKNLSEMTMFLVKWSS